MTSSWWDTSSTVLGRYFSTHGTVEVDATCIGSAELELELELLLLEEEALANMLAICKGVRGRRKGAGAALSRGLYLMSVGTMGTMGTMVCPKVSKKGRWGNTAVKTNVRLITCTCF